MRVSRWVAVLAVFVIVLTAANANAYESVPSWGDPSIHYGSRFYELYGDLSASGLQGIDGRPAYLNRWEAYFEDFVSKETKQLNKYDVYNIQEVNEGEDFTDKRGYGLVPLKENVVKDFVRYANGNPDFVWSKVKNYNNVTQKGYYVLNGTMSYVSMAHLVELSGGAFDRLQSRVQDNPGAINGTVWFQTSPWPKITSAVYDGKEARITFTTFGLNSLHRPRVTLTNGVDKLEHDFGYTSKSTFNATWAFPAREIERLGSPEKLRVVVEDGYGRTAEAKLDVVLNGVDYYVLPMSTPLKVTMFADDQSVPYRINIGFARRDNLDTQVPYHIKITGPGGTVERDGVVMERNKPLMIPYNLNVTGPCTIKAEIWPVQKDLEINPKDNTYTIQIVVERLKHPRTGPKEPQIHVELGG